MKVKTVSTEKWDLKLELDDEDTPRRLEIVFLTDSVPNDIVMWGEINRMILALMDVSPAAIGEHVRQVFGRIGGRSPISPGTFGDLMMRAVSGAPPRTNPLAEAGPQVSNQGPGVELLRTCPKCNQVVAGLHACPIED